MVKSLRSSYTGLYPQMAAFALVAHPRLSNHPGVELRANLDPISHRCHLFEVAFVWEFTKETIHWPLGCLQGGEERSRASILDQNHRVHTILRAVNGVFARFCYTFRNHVRKTPPMFLRYCLPQGRLMIYPRIIRKIPVWSGGWMYCLP